MTYAMLKHLNNLISNGQPLWAILSLNESEGTENPLARALRQKARAQLLATTPQLTATILTRVLEGAPLGSFTAEEQSVLKGEKALKINKPKAFCPRPMLHSRQGHALSPRSRSSRTFRFAMASNSL